MKYDILYGRCTRIYIRVIECLGRMLQRDQSGIFFAWLLQIAVCSSSSNVNRPGKCGGQWEKRYKRLRRIGLRLSGRHKQGLMTTFCESPTHELKEMRKRETHRHEGTCLNEKVRICDSSTNYIHPRKMLFYSVP